MSQHDTVPTDADITRDRGSIDPDHYTPEEQARWQYADGLRALANFIEVTPGAPLPPAHLVEHYKDADGFDAATTVIDVTASAASWAGGYEIATRKFGRITYGAQMESATRKAQQIRRREKAIAARERELGLSSEDIAARELGLSSTDIGTAAA